jgi:hypothetical protein
VTQPSPRGHGRRGELGSREEQSSSPLKEAMGWCSGEVVAWRNGERRGRALFKGVGPVHHAPSLCTDGEKGGSDGWSSWVASLQL